MARAFGCRIGSTPIVDVAPWKEMARSWSPFRLSVANWTVPGGGKNPVETAPANGKTGVVARQNRLAGLWRPGTGWAGAGCQSYLEAFRSDRCGSCGQSAADHDHRHHVGQCLSVFCRQESRARDGKRPRTAAPAKVATRLVAEPDLLKLQGEQREAMSPFTDIEGFSTTAEIVNSSDVIGPLDG